MFVLENGVKAVYSFVLLFLGNSKLSIFFSGSDHVVYCCETASSFGPVRRCTKFFRAPTFVERESYFLQPSLINEDSVCNGTFTSPFRIHLFAV